MRISDWSSDVCSSDVLDVFPAGVGMTPFVKPGVSEPYPDMAAAAIRAALTDARVPYYQVQHAYAGYVYGDSTAGQCCLYVLGLTGIPVFNVTNNSTEDRRDGKVW